MVCIDAQGQPSRRKRGRGVGSAKWKESWHEIQEGGRSCAACHQVNRSPGTEQSGLQLLCPSVVAGAWQQEWGGGGAQRECFCTACPLRCVSLVPCSLSVLVSLGAKLSLNAWSGENCNLLGEKE